HAPEACRRPTRTRLAVGNVLGTRIMIAPGRQAQPVTWRACHSGFRSLAQRAQTGRYWRSHTRLKKSWMQTQRLRDQQFGVTVKALAPLAARALRGDHHR